MCAGCSVAVLAGTRDQGFQQSVALSHRDLIRDALDAAKKKFCEKHT
jgi:hypothetical protein